MRNIELSVIAAALTNKDRLLCLLEYPAEIFREPDLAGYRKIIGKLAEGESIVDVPMLATHGKLDGKRIAEILQAPVCLNLENVLKQMDDRRRRENIKYRAMDLVNALKDEKLDYDEMIDAIVNEKNTDIRDNICELFEYLNNNDLDDIFKQLHYIKTNIQPIDAKVFGFYAGQFIIIAGRPGTGKTSLVLEMVQRMTEPVLYFSLEMPRQELYAKMLSAIAAVDAWKIIFGRLADEERVRVLMAHEHLKKINNITLIDGDVDLAHLVYYINHYVPLKKPKCIVIDYLQLLAGAKGENQNVRTGVISRTLKLLAMKHKIPIVALSQMSRAVTKEKREPALSDLRDSGSLEQDANMVIFLHEPEDDKTEIIVSKNRLGRIGKIVGLKFDKQFSRFIEEGTLYDMDYINN